MSELNKPQSPYVDSIKSTTDSVIDTIKTPQITPNSNGIANVIGFIIFAIVCYCIFDAVAEQQNGNMIKAACITALVGFICGLIAHQIVFSILNPVLSLQRSMYSRPYHNYNNYDNRPGMTLRI